MVKKEIKTINRTMCQDFCDLSGKTGNYRKAWIYSLLIDIVIPIALFLVGISTAITGLILSIFLPNLGVLLAGGFAIILFLFTIGVIIFLYFLEFREIGLFVLIPIVMNGIALVLRLIPIIGIIGYMMALVPWNIIAVFMHFIIEGKAR